MKWYRFKKKYGGIIPTVLLIIIALLFLFPLLWLLFASFNEHAVQAFTMPDSMSLGNFRSVIGDKKNIQGFINSLIIAGFQTTLVLICSVLMAYPLSRYKMKHAQRITMFMLFLTSIPILAVMVPIFQLFITLRLVDSIFGTVIFMAATALPYGIWMSKNFLDSVPIELEESAWIDGATSIQSLCKVVLPLMVPGLFTVTIFTFLGSWGNFFVPFILLQSTEKLPASVNIYRFFGERGTVVYGQLAAYSLLYMMPVFVLYFFSQNHMSKGFAMSGAAKG